LSISENGIKWHLEQKKIEELKPFENNPRNITEKGLKDLSESIDRFGLAEPIVINTDNTIIGGHARYFALKERGEKECKCYIPNRKLTTKEVKELNVRLNKNIAGEWDFDILANAFEFDDLLEWGWEENELDINLWKEEIDEEKLDDVPEPQKEAVSQLGDVFLIDGKHRVMCGDSTKAEDVEKLMDGKKADMCFTDMPYGISKEGIKNDNLSKDDFYNFNDKYIQLIPAKNNSAFICYHSTRTFNPTINVAEINGWKFEKMFFSHRPDKFPVHTWNGWMMTSQAILLFTKGKAEFYKISPAQQDVYRITSKDLTEKKVNHPTVKPVNHLMDMMKHFVSVLIYEPFLGSGSTLIAAEQTNRICYGMELDPVYVDVILRRYKNLYPNAEIKCLNRKVNLEKLWAKDEK
jgi:DNA modification methylase